MRKNQNPFAAFETSRTLPFPAWPTRRILVVDDDPFFCHRNAEVLIQQGYEVNATEDGARGWAELQANLYHLLITESELPSLTGVELIQKLRSARLTLPVIIAADKPPKMAEACRLRLQPVVTLLKPYTLADFLETVKVVLNKNHDLPNPARPAPAISAPFNSVRVAEGWLDPSRL